MAQGERLYWFDEASGEWDFYYWMDQATGDWDFIYQSDNFTPTKYWHRRGEVDGSEKRALNAYYNETHAEAAVDPAGLLASAPAPQDTQMRFAPDVSFHAPEGQTHAKALVEPTGLVAVEPPGVQTGVAVGSL